MCDLYRGTLTYRRLWVLINRLPQESWTQTALRDDPERQDLVAPEQAAEQRFGPWSQAELLLAAVVDAVNSVRFAVVRVNGNKDYPAPDPLPRPGVNRPVRFEKPSEEALQFLEKLRARRVVS